MRGRVSLQPKRPRGRPRKGGDEMNTVRAVNFCPSNRKACQTRGKHYKETVGVGEVGIGIDCEEDVVELAIGLEGDAVSVGLSKHGAMALAHMLAEAARLL